MTKRDLIEAVSAKAHLSKKAVSEVVDLFLGEIGKALGKGEKRVVVSGFGTFYVHHIAKSRTVKIPKTDKTVTIKPHRMAKFSPGRNLRKQVSR